MAPDDRVCARWAVLMSYNQRRGPGFPTPREGERLMVGVEWAVDGRPMPLVWSEAQMEAPGGFGSLGEVSCPSSFWPLS